jgi:hypothetical protein
MTAHELAKQLLEKPDLEVTIVKSEGNQCISEYALHAGGPWVAFSQVRIQIEPRVAQATAGS